MDTDTLKQGDRICVKLVNNIQNRADNSFRQIEDVVDEDQTEHEELKGVLETTKEFLSLILNNLDLLEDIIQKQGDEDSSEQNANPFFEAIETNPLTAKVEQLFADDLPDVYDMIQEFIEEQPDNIAEVKFMVEKFCYSSRKREAAIRVIGIIETCIGQMEEFYTVKDTDSTEISDQYHQHDPEMQDFEYSPLRSFDETSFDQNSYDLEVFDDQRKDRPGSSRDESSCYPDSFYENDDYPPETNWYDATNSLSDIPSDDVKDGPLPTKKDGTPDMRFRVNKLAYPHLRKDLKKERVEGKHLKKDGTPDLRFKENRPKKPVLLKKGETVEDIHLKKDGTPDRRYKENKKTTQTVSLANSSGSKNIGRTTSTPLKSATTGPLKKDGTPDMRYSVNKSPESSSGSSSSNKPTPAKITTTGPVKKDGTPDMRFTANKNTGSSTRSGSYGSGSSTSSSVGLSNATPGPLKKDGTPDMRYSVNKNFVSSSASSYSKSSRSSGSSSSSSRSSYSGYAGGISSYSSGSSFTGGSRSSSAGGSSSSYCPGPLTKSGAPDMRFSVNKAYFK